MNYKTYDLKLNTLFNPFFVLSIYLLLFITNLNIVQSEVIGIDTVYYFKPGLDQTSGQQLEYFPKNIFGVPSPKANKNVPESSPEEVCSIGFGGEIIVGIKDNLIINREGYDFKIFENVFINPINKKYFVEPALVSVSQDGINFIEFLYNYNTLEGCAGTLPTERDSSEFNLDFVGGNSFDLSEIGLDYIKYIKIKDITELIKNNPNHFYYDPILTGFDLDAVVAKYVTKDNITSVSFEDYSFQEFRSKFKILTQQNKIYISTESNLNLNNCKIVVFDVIGNLLFEKQNYVGNDHQFNNNLEIDNLKTNQLLIVNIIYKSYNLTFKIY